MKQEDNIARLWSVSRELFLTCSLLNALSRSKEPRLDVQLHLTMTMNNEYLHVHILACILYLHKNIMSDKQRFKLHWTFPLLLSPIPTSLTDKNELQLVLGTHTGMLTTVVWFLFFFCPTVTCKDQTVLEMIRNRLQLFYQVVQSRALRNEP